MKKIFSLILGISILASALASAPDSTKLPLSISCDLVSRYIWRGIDEGNSPSIQPDIHLTLKNFTIGFWGAYSTSKLSYQEADLYASYNFLKYFTIGLTDYFFPPANQPYNYFNYKAKTTGHVIEAQFQVASIKNIPLSIFLGINIWGADAPKLDPKTGKQIGIQHSTYLELDYSFKNLQFFAGANLTQPNLSAGETGFYADKRGLINLGLKATKNLIINKNLSLPLYVSLITNPVQKHIFLISGITF
jgi:hypothetical protein